MPLPLLFAPWQRYGHDWAASIFLPWMPQHCLPCGFLFLEVTSYDSGWGKYGNLVRIRHCFPGPGRKIELCLAAHSGRLAPPRFSRSCPHCLRLWLDRGTIVGRQGHGETACHSCFWLDDFSLAAGEEIFLSQQVLAHLPYRFPGLRLAC